MNEIFHHAVVGPAIEATTTVSSPIVGATTKFAISLRRDGKPITNAVVTLIVRDASGIIVYPLSGTGSTPVPASTNTPGLHLIVPNTVAIFTQEGYMYTVYWNVTVPAFGEYPVSILPVVQRYVCEGP